MSLLFNALVYVYHSFPSNEEASFNFMAAVTIHSDFWAHEGKICHCFHFSSHLFAMKWWYWMPWSLFFDGWLLSQIFHFLLSASSRVFLVPLFFLPLEWYHLHIWGCWYLSWQSLFQLVILPAWHFAWCTLHRSKISGVKIYSLDVILSQFLTSLLFHVQF